MAGYRLYFLDRQGSIQARQDFVAENDAEALTIGDLLWQACADCYASFELWNLGRHIAAPRADAGKRLTPLEAVPHAILRRVLELEEALRDSPWRAARSARLADAIDRLSRLLNRAPPITTDEIVRHIRAATDTPMTSFQRVEEGVLKLRGSYGFERWFDEYFDVVGDDCSCGVAFKYARQMIVPDIEASPIFAGQESLKVLRAAGVAACISTPLRAPDGAVQGMFSIHKSRFWNPASGEIDQIDALARDISAAILDPASAAAAAIRRGI